MDELQFASELTIDQENCQEHYSTLWSIPQKTYYFDIGLGVVEMLAPMLLYFFARELFAPYLKWLLLVGSIWMLTKHLLWKKSRAQGLESYVRKIREEGPAQLSVRLYEKGFVSENSTRPEPYTAEYGDLRAVGFTEHFVYLLTRDQVMVTLDRQGLTGGTDRELLGFLVGQKPKLDVRGEAAIRQGQTSLKFTIVAQIVTIVLTAALCVLSFL